MIDIIITNIIEFLKTEAYHQILYDYSMKISPDTWEDKTWYICFNVAEFIQDLIINQLPKKRKGRERKVHLDELYKLSGVYHIAIDNQYESHAFIAWFQEDHIHIINGYGGYYGNPLYITTSKKEWTDKFLSLQNHNLIDQIKLLNELFGIPNDLLSEVYDKRNYIIMEPLMSIFKLC
ncbi:hypothetical protein Klosneuvirus_3_150 [Klosneuvirus KNV1]|uniref:Uncharacterized protein n=1 Tax=Klosneuvirus KNV1 TaxID=1977640 RepID=A0A1V0SJV5_9VIRU|nr:hypothetical protein Klosneuvirus_3_150 [Klosneuvirus KNV1]